MSLYVCECTSTQVKAFYRYHAVSDQLFINLICGFRSAMLVQVIVSIVAVYIISRLIQYGLQYRKWLQLTSKINPIGKIHPIWGHFALVSVDCHLSVYRAGHYLAECQHQLVTSIYIHICIYIYVIVLGLLKLLRNPRPHVMLTR